jgi:hypothetical protein
MALRAKEIKDAGSVGYRSPVDGTDDRPARERGRRDGPTMRSQSGER